MSSYSAGRIDRPNGFDYMAGGLRPRSRSAGASATDRWL